MSTETVFLKLKGAQESIPPAYVAWRPGTTTLFLLSQLLRPTLSRLVSDIPIYPICSYYALDIVDLVRRYMHWIRGCFRSKSCQGKRMFWILFVGNAHSANCTSVNCAKICSAGQYDFSLRTYFSASRFVPDSLFWGQVDHRRQVWARIFKLLRSPRIHSKESIS